MYIRKIVDENIGPIKNINISFAFNSDGTPKPIVLVGENGSGKSTLLSNIVDAFYEIAGKAFDNAWETTENGGHQYYKAISTSQITVGNEYMYSYISFDDEKTINYVLKSGKLSTDNFTVLSGYAANSGISWEENENYKNVDIEEKKSENQMPAFEQALRADGLSFICEAKKASPSKGLIAPDFPYVEIARDYEAGGAAAISCLTEPFWFQGSDAYLKEIVQNVSIPVLRKDFTCDEYMIYQAKAMGASAVLLICSVLEDGRLKAYHQLAEELGLSALVETHSEEEILRAQKIGAKIIGVNNRNLKDFTVDINNSIRLRELVSPEVVFVSESGIRGAEDMKALYENGTDAVLIGELLMRKADRKTALLELKQQTGRKKHA